MIDQLKTAVTPDLPAMFAACDHDSRRMGHLLALLQLLTDERLEVGFAHSITNNHIRHYRDELLQALGIDTSYAA